MPEKIEQWNEGWTRRELLTRIGQVGGAAALYETMIALGLINTPDAWASWGNDQHDDKDYERLLAPDKRFYIVGDQASTLPGWQEGAMMSAEHVVELIGGVKEAVAPKGIKAPNTFKILQGLG